MRRFKRGEVRTVEHRPFKFRVGLRQGYKPGSPIYNKEFAIEMFLKWNLERAKDKWPYLPCDAIEATRVYCWGSGEEAVGNTEPVIIFEGEVSPFLADESDELIKMMLDELGEWLANKLGQERIEIVYRNETWPLVPDDGPDPDAETN